MSDDVSQNIGGDKTPGSIAILGSSGFVGTYLTLNLAQMGNRLRLLHHHINPDFVSPRGRIETVQGSIRDVDSLARCFEGVDAVYHLVAIIAETKDKTFGGLISKGTANVVAAAKQAGVEKIFYVSALGTSNDPPTDYFRAKYEAELSVIGSGLDYTIFRPSIVYGIGDDFINRIVKMVKFMPVVPVIGHGRYRFQPVYVEELTAVMADSLRRNFTSKKTYEIGGPEKLTYLEILDIIKRVMGKKRGTVHVPKSIARLGAAVLEALPGAPPVTRDQITMMEMDITCDHTVVEKEFGVTFSPLEKQLHMYVGKL